jgi:NAD(P)H-hydrate epimerase
MKILTGDQMALWDKRSIQKHKISAQSLMRAAATQCCRILTEQEGWNSQSKVVIICGPGNNGGDGLAMTLLLRQKGIKVISFFMGKTEKLSLEAKYFHDKVKKDLLSLNFPKHLKELSLQLKKADFIVDALFGIGLSRPLTGLYKKVILTLNQSRAVKLAVDIPSGLCSNTGQVLGEAFQANLTVTFEAPKWGQILPPAWDYVGQLYVEPIGLSKKELIKIFAEAEWIDSSMAQKLLPTRAAAIHKGKAGQVLVVAGSLRMPGAGYLCALSALRAGAGLVRWLLPQEAFQKIDLRYPEVILQPIASTEGKFDAKGIGELAKLFKRFHSLALGPGLGQGGTLANFIKGILKISNLPIVIDADGLDALAKNPKLLSLVKGCILTPHPREMSRLCGKSLQEVLSKRIQTAKDFSKKYHVWLVLKGYRSIIAGPKGEIYINSTGGPNLATAGSGDVLTGMIAAFLAQGLKAKEALLLGVYLHGLAGDILAQCLGDRGTIASDIAKVIPLAIKELRGYP